MAPFYPLYVRRSDGVLVTSTRHKKEANEPTPEQLDQTPDDKGVADYYRHLPREEPKHLDWRRKLGTMLIREIGTKDQIFSERGHILYDLPDNYRLYEHIKSKAKLDDGQNPTKQPKNHSGGGHDRQDAYLYGHPQGRKKRYRSPGDFFPHLLWLATDPEGDPNNCTCKVCAPEEFQPDEPKELKAQQIKRENFQTVAVDNTEPATPANDFSSTAVQYTSLSSAKLPSHQSAVQNPPQPSTTISQIQKPRPLPQPIDSEQQVDLEYNNFIYRLGELLWFNRGDAWGLGVVVRRFKWGTNPQSPIRAYVVQPLSHPFQYQPQVTLTSDAALRPWLKWSAPGLMTAGLARIRNLTYDSTDWNGVLSGLYGERANAEVDASILAAKAIDATYTLIRPIATVGSGVELREQDRRYAGLFFGGEKIWVGDPVRLHTKTGNYVLVVHGIAERTQTYPNQPPMTAVILSGDCFRLAQVVDPQTDQPPTVGVLPTRMVKDLEARNTLVQTKLFWKYSGSQTQYGLHSIRGRWYEASVHGPRIEPEQWQAAVASGYISEACDKWNGRGDAQREEDNKHSLVQRQSRLAAFGKAVPQNMALVEGVDAPPPVEIARLLDANPAQAQQQEQEPEPEPMPIDEGFLNFDDEMSGFQSGFNSGHGGPTNFYG